MEENTEFGQRERKLTDSPIKRLEQAVLPHNVGLILRQIRIRMFLTKIPSSLHFREDHPILSWWWLLLLSIKVTIV